MDKYLSVITNFGCHYSCPYCVVKENGLHIPKTTIGGLRLLRKSILEHNCTWVSVSGGGDPLHNYYKNSKWFNGFFKAIPQGVKTELHTSYIDYDERVYFPYDRVVYHLRNMSDINIVKRYNNQKIRVVFVVTENFTPSVIHNIYSLVTENPNIDELSFRQMIDSNYNVTHYCEDFLRVGHKSHWYYITHCDYNLYYAENKIFTKYEDLKNENFLN